MGAALARAELRIVAELVLRRLPGLRLHPDREPRRNLSMITFGFCVAATAMGHPDVGSRPSTDSVLMAELTDRCAGWRAGLDDYC